MLKFLKFKASQNYKETHVWIVLWDDSKNREIELLSEQCSIKINNNRISFKTDQEEYVAYMFYI